MATLTQVYRQSTAPSPVNAGDVWVRPDGSSALYTGPPGWLALGSTSSAVPVDAVQATTILTSTNTEVADGDTVTVGSASQGQGGRTYTFRTNLTRATGTITDTATAVADGDTITVGGVVYRFKDTLASNNDVHRSATASVNLTNLAKAIMDNGTADTDYKVASGNSGGAGASLTVTSGTLQTDHIIITAIAAGSLGHYAFTATSAGTVRLTFPAAMSGGVDDEVHISNTADNTLLALARLINGTGAGTEGTDYSRRANAEADQLVSSTTSVDTHTITLTAKAVPGASGADGNAIATTTAAAGTNRLSFTGATLAGGVDGTLGEPGQTSTDGTYLYCCVSPNVWKKITLEAL